jgi:hypothetical protein
MAAGWQPLVIWDERRQAGRPPDDVVTGGAQSRGRRFLNNPLPKKRSAGPTAGTQPASTRRRRLSLARSSVGHLSGPSCPPSLRQGCMACMWQHGPTAWRRSRSPSCMEPAVHGTLPSQGAPGSYGGCRQRAAAVVGARRARAFAHQGVASSTCRSWSIGSRNSLGCLGGSVGWGPGLVWGWRRLGAGGARVWQGSKGAVRFIPGNKACLKTGMGHRSPKARDQAWRAPLAPTPPPLIHTRSTPHPHPHQMSLILPSAPKTSTSTPSIVKEGPPALGAMVERQWVKPTERSADTAESRCLHLML